jgi:hypothetical protein
VISSLITRECSIIRRAESGTTDELGNDIPSEVVTASYWELQQRRRDEPSDQGELSDTTWDAFFRSGTDLDTSDSVVDGPTGEQYELVGDPWEVRNPRTGVESHVQATVRRAAGAKEGS